jgi:hypothetical protein
MRNRLLAMLAIEARCIVCVLTRAVRHGENRILLHRNTQLCSVVAGHFVDWPRCYGRNVMQLMEFRSTHVHAPSHYGERVSTRRTGDRDDDD